MLLVIHFVVVSCHQHTPPLISDSPWFVAAVSIALAAASVHSTRWSQILAQNRDFCLPHLHSTPQLGGHHRNIAVTLGMEKLEWFDYPTRR